MILPRFKLTTLASLSLYTLTAAQGLIEELEGSGFNIAVPGTQLFEEQTQPFNRRYAVKPAVVTFPSTTSQVAQIVSTAKTYGYKVAPRSGGHSYVAHGLGTANGTVVIDMASFKNVALDASTNVASVGAGNRIGELVTKLNAVGRALPHGTCSYVGWGGHATIGGYGFTSRMWGLTLDTIEEAEAVLSNGTTVIASPKENPDLFWALRGGGPYLAIVTSLKVRTFPAPPSATIFSFNWQLSVDDASSALSTYQSYALTSPIPRELGIQGVLTRGGAKGNVSFGFSGGWYGPASGLNETLKPLLDAIGFEPRTRTFDEGDYLHSAENLAGGSLDTSAPGGRDTFYAKSLVTPAERPMSRKAIERFISTLANEGFESELGWWFVQIDLFGDANSAISKPSGNDTVFPHRNALFAMQMYGSSRDNVPPYPQSGFGFLDRAVESIVTNMPRDWGHGAYAAYMDDRIGYQGGDLYYKHNYRRLRRVKEKYDPDSTFSFPVGWKV